jgi:hypothetical protein
MIRYARTRACLASVAMLGAFTASTAVPAQTAPNPYVYRIPPGAFNPVTARRNLTLAVPARPSVTPATPVRRSLSPTGSAAASNPNAPAVTMGPSRGPVGTRIQVQVNRNLGATPVILSFKAVVSRGVPARVHTRLFGGGNSYSTSAPIQLCIQGGGTWEAELVLSNGRNLGVIGSFTPTNCPR